MNGRDENAKEKGVHKAALKCARKLGVLRGASGKARKTPSGDKSKGQRGRAGDTRPVGSIFAQTRADHGAYLCAAWCFAHKMCRSQAVALTGLHNVRLAAAWDSVNVAEGELLGGGSRVVVIDEAFVARRKYNRGRAIPTHKVCIFAGVELEPAGKTGAEGEGRGGSTDEDADRPRYVETGRCFLVRIADRAAGAFKREIRPRVLPGSTVWTDSHRSYGRLEDAGEFRRRSANHSSAEFPGDEGQSTNAVEGIWPRVKRGLRMSCVRKPADGDYGPLPAEYVWRPRNVRGAKWRKDAFPKVAGLIARHFGPAFQQTQWADAGYECVGKPSLYADDKGGGSA